MLSRLEFFFTETALSLRRHPAMAFAAIICVASTLFVASFAGLAYLNANYAVTSAIDKVRFNVFFQVETSRDEANAAVERLKALDGVDTVQFVPKEIAWHKLKTEDPTLAKEFATNPYPDEAVVKVRDVNQIAAISKDVSSWAEVHDVRDQVEFAGRLETIRGGVGRFGFAMGILLAILSLVIIHHTIELTLYARRKEIHIMSLVGATPTTVAMPFILEGLFYGIFGAGVALGCAYILYRYVSSFLLNGYGAHLQWDQSVLANGCLTILIAGAALGFIGSVVSVTKYLHQPRSKVTNA